MNEIINIIVPDDAAGARLDKTLSGHLPDMSRARIQALIKENCLTLCASTGDRIINSPSHSVKFGEHYRLEVPQPEEPIPQPEDIPLTVVFEDEHLIVIDKPAGMVVHPAPGNTSGTLVNALLHHCGNSLSGIGGVKRPGIVHRIDKDTSGLLVVAKNDKAHHGLADQFASHSIERKYHAVCKGHPRPYHGRIEGNIGRNPHDRKKMTVVKAGGKHAVTHYRTLNLYQQSGTALAAHIECQLETGRTHQVRVHMMHTGHALIGDPLYAKASIGNSIKGEARTAIQSFKRQALHAKSLGFEHPISGECFKFESELPYDLSRLLDDLSGYIVAGSNN
ncbi:RluA family pseudouridine synthase [Kordiimonas aquimaris]|uniref:RluA family pseudouridine synthase n=1 Tax=Kordiimonas aquimaris TaxID=707591 RepID=UPI0021D0B6BC|nr:RluA family pseudouridine synthase [Kordiimonas aquimaris]